MTASDEMGWALTAIRITLAAVFLLLLPQVAGYLWFRRTRHKRTSLRLSAFLVPPLVFLFGSCIFWWFFLEVLEPSGNRFACGMPYAAAGYATFYGMPIHLAFGLFVFFAANFIWKRKTLRAPKERL